MSSLRQKAVRIVAVLKEHGYEAYFAGGCVRDMIMGRTPDDYDIATSARPEEVAGLFPKTVFVGEQFGVVRVVEDSHHFEVATFRTERGYTDGRHPDVVEFSDARGDVHRRDFTINAILYDPIDGTKLDYVGGEKDIAARLVRAVGDPKQRFGDDYLRMLRAVRFAARFGFSIESATLEAIRGVAHRIQKVSNERIGIELLKIFGGPNPGTGLRLLSDTGLLRHVLPEVEDMKGVEQPENYHPEGDVYRHTLLCMEHMKQPRSPEFALAVLLHDVGKPPTFTRDDRIRFPSHEKIGAEIAGRIARRLRLSNEQTNYIKRLVKSHMKFMAVREMKESTLKRFLRDPDFEDILELHRLDCAASNGVFDAWEYCRQKQEELAAEEIAPPPLFTGHDLIDLGYQPGPAFKRILTRLEDAQLEGEISTKEEAEKLVLREFPRDKL